jgi:hypothetical protein
MNSTALFRDYSKPALAATRTASTSASLEGGHSSLDDDGRQDIEKLPGKVTLASSSPPSPSSTSEERDTTSNNATSKATGTDGVTLIIKKNQGLTRLLQRHGELMTLLEGPYPQHPRASMLQTDRLVLIGGGIGITGLLAWAHAGHRNVKLAWSVKASAEALVREIETMALRDAVAEKEVVVGNRLDLDAMLHREACAGYARVGVVVCGPAAMCDDVRARVAGLGRAAPNDTRFELEVLAFSW